MDQPTPKTPEASRRRRSPRRFAPALVALLAVAVPGAATTARADYVGAKQFLNAVNRQFEQSGHPLSNPANDLLLYETLVKQRNEDPARFDHQHHLVGHLLADEHLCQNVLDRFHDHPGRFTHYHHYLMPFLIGCELSRHHPPSGMVGGITEMIPTPSPQPQPQPQEIVLAVPAPPSLVLMGLGLGAVLAIPRIRRAIGR